MKLLLIWLCWISVYFGMEYAGDWYFDSGLGNLLNGAFTFCILGLVAAFFSTWWSKAYLVVGIAQLSVFLTDQTFPLPEDQYDSLVGTLNTLEFLLLFMAGGLTTLWGLYAKYRNRMDVVRRHLNNG